MQNVEQNKKIFHVPYKLFTRICQSFYLYICPIHFGSSGYLSIALKLILSNSLEWATPQEGESPVKITTLPHPKKWGFFVKVFFNQHISTDVQCTGARCYQDQDSQHLLSGSSRTDKSFGGHVQCWHWHAAKSSQQWESESRTVTPLGMEECGRIDFSPSQQ